MDEQQQPDPADPDQPASDDDDSGQVLGSFDTGAHGEEEAVREDRFLNSSPLSPVTADEPDDQPDDAPDGDQEEGSAADQGTVPFDEDAEDSDDEEIKKLEAEANVASDDDNEEASAAPVPNAGTADGQLIADIFGESDSEDEGFEVSTPAPFLMSSNLFLLCGNRVSNESRPQKRILVQSPVRPVMLLRRMRPHHPVTKRRMTKIAVANRTLFTTLIS